VQRHLHLGRARPQRAPARLDQCAQSVDHNGGLDAYLLKAKADVLSPRALELKRAIQKKVGKPVFVKKAS